MPSKTVICVWTQEECLFFIIEGDYSHLDGVVINTIAVDGLTAEDLDSESNRKYAEENPSNTRENQRILTEVLFDEAGWWRSTKLKSADVMREIRDGAEFVQAGCIL